MLDGQLEPLHQRSLISESEKGVDEHRMVAVGDLRAKVANSRVLSVGNHGSFLQVRRIVSEDLVPL